MQRIKTILLFLILCQLSFAQVPTLSIHHKQKMKKLSISQLQVNVEILGNTATTTYDIQYYNPHDKVLTGELSMPLKNGQDICRYALDVNGKLREGVVVEKVKARQTFEAVVRQQVDPGIINKTKGNHFKTKIYPVPAQGSKRVVIAFVETLSGNGNRLFYTLPIENMQEVKQFSLDVRAIKSRVKSKIKSSGFQNIKFDNQDDAYVLHLERKDFSAKEPIKFTVPRFSGKDHQLFTYELEGKNYFYLNLKPDQLKSKKKASPKKVAILWDHSFSASKRNLSKEFQLVRSYLSTLKSGVEISLTLFNQSVSNKKYFTSADEFIQYIKSVKNDGATQFENIKLPQKADEILLFSDGVNTIGQEELKDSKVPVYTITSVAGSNTSFLKQISNQSNGEHIDLSILSEERALQILLLDEEKFLSCEFDSKLLTEVYPRVATRVDEYFQLTGILNSDKAELKVNFGGKNGVTQTKSYEISQANGSEAVARIWASKKILDLSADQEKNKEEIISLSQDFKIVTTNTSLLVLDRIQDYVKYKITPPADLLEEYKKLLAFEKDNELDKTFPEQIRQKNEERFQRLKRWYHHQPNYRINDKRYRRRRGNPVSRHRSAPRFQHDSTLQFENVDEVIIMPQNSSNEMEIEDCSVDMVDNVEEEEESAGNSSSAGKSSLQVLSWIPDASYMKELRDADDHDLLPLYYRLKEEHKNRPSFYIQIADLFFSKGKQKDAVRILSNTIELDLENPELMKVVGRRFLDEGEYDLALKIFQEIKELRPEEPQSYRDLAMTYHARGEFQNALENYLHILNHEWDRFEEIKDAVLNEFNNLISRHRDDLDLSEASKELIEPMPLDLRITIDWSSNENDIDLWVVDPNGEKCFYSHPHTRTGGKITSDFTRGYGPEEFSLRKAKRGFYTVYVNYYSESRQTITGPVTVYAELSTHYGTKQQKTKRISIQLENDNGKKTMQIGQLEFKE